MPIPFHCEQIQFVADIAAGRSEFWDPVFRFLNYADSIYFVFVLIPFVWVGFSWRWGLRLAYLMIINMLINHAMKELVGWPRPCQDVPELGMLCPRSFGFPSGAAQTCMLLGALLIHTWRTRAAWIIGVSYIALVSFSRLYLGVHYPIDLLGGWVLGLALFGCYVVWIGPIERFFHRQSLERCLVWSLALPAALMAVTSERIYHRFDTMAVGVGAFLSLKYGWFLPAPKSVGEGLVRGAVAVGGLFVIWWILPGDWPKILNLSILSLWISAVASFVYKRFVL